MKRLAVALCTLALTAPIAGLARAPYTPAGSDVALLRFSWRMSVSAKERCRPRTEQELAALPVHMRTPEVCTRDVARYTLATRIDEEPAQRTALLRGGVKGDRPLFVLRELPLEPGRHRVQVALERTSEDARETLASLDTVLVMEAGAVQLVTLESETRRLVVRSGAR